MIEWYNKGLIKDSTFTQWYKMILDFNKNKNVTFHSYGLTAQEYLSTAERIYLNLKD